MIADLRWPAWALVNLGAFCAALVLPLVHLSHFYIFENDIVLYRLPVVLAENGEILLAAVVATLGIALPMGKAMLFCAAPWRPRIARAVGILTPLSFFDVFLVALLIFIAKGAVATDAASGPGIYPMAFFAVSTKLMEWRFSHAAARKSG